MTIPERVVLFGFPWPDMPFEIKIAVLTAIVVPISVIVTFLTPAVSKEKLEEFYRRVRPDSSPNRRMGKFLPMLLI